ncbi:MAG: class I SAM-dependent methyltransferase [Hydrogeniiclostridium mannosilyticum]
MYPLLIQQFLDDYNLSAGVALDIGTGPGNLAVELAKVTAMDLILVDIDGEALRTAQSRLFELGVDNRISTLCADVEKLPLRDNLADFIMCRGSIGFWPVPVQGITEIYRVLKPGGCAIVAWVPDGICRKPCAAGSMSPCLLQIEQLPPPIYS